LINATNNAKNSLSALKKFGKV